jgi:hypothetical protein
MSRAFNTNSARPTFGVFKEPQTTGDYIFNKKVKTTFCPRNNSISCKSFNTQGNLLLTKHIGYKLINTANLNINLITELNLKDVNVFQTVDMNSQPYFYYNIDPSGQLFGNTICGTNNFLNYLEYNPPHKTSNT